MFLRIVGEGRQGHLGQKRRAPKKKQIEKIV
jgi:hypothetical protein